MKAEGLEQFKGVENITPVHAMCGTEAGITAIKNAVGDKPVHYMIFTGNEAPELKPILETSREALQYQMDTSQNGLVFLAQALLPNLKKAGEEAGEGDKKFKPRVLGMSPFAFESFVPVPQMGAYASNKVAFKYLIKILQVEAADIACFGIANVSVIDTDSMHHYAKISGPGPIQTMLQDRIDKKNFYKSDEVAVWVAALLNAEKCDDKTFNERAHYIDQGSHRQGVTFTQETTESKDLADK